MLAITILALVLSAGLGEVILGVYAFNKITRSRNFSIKECFEIVEGRELYLKSDFEDLTKEDVCIKSRDNLSLKGYYIKGDTSSNKTMVFVHGYTVPFPWSLQFIDIFLEKGWSILLVEQRRHGRSEGKYSTYGYLEKHDLDMWVKWVVERNGPNVTIGMHGVSMGGGTVLEYAAINRYAKFIIAECPYSDLYELIKYQIRSRNHLPLYPLIYIVDAMLFRFAGFRMKDVSPINAVKDSETPVMFIHGRDDDFVPAYMSERMYETKKGGKKLLLIDGAGHGEAYEKDAEKYKKEMMAFVDEALL